MTERKMNKLVIDRRRELADTIATGQMTPDKAEKMIKDAEDKLVEAFSDTEIPEFLVRDRAQDLVLKEILKMVSDELETRRES